MSFGKLAQILKLPEWYPVGSAFRQQPEVFGEIVLQHFLVHSRFTLHPSAT